MSRERNDWWTRAACAGLSPLFDDDIENFELVSDTYRGRTRAQNRAAAAAVRICHGCPVQVECLKDAMEYGDLSGIRGGLRAFERAALMRKAGKRLSSLRDVSRGLDEAILRMRAAEEDRLREECYD